MKKSVWPLIGLVALLALTLSVLMCFPAYAQSKFAVAFDHGGEPDLERFRIHWGSATGAYTESLDILLADYVPDLPMATNRWLLPGSYFFVATAIDQAGNESGYSNEVAFVVEDATPFRPMQLRITITNAQGVEIIIE